MSDVSLLCRHIHLCFILFYFTHAGDCTHNWKNMLSTDWAKMSDVDVERVWSYVLCEFRPSDHWSWYLLTSQIKPHESAIGLK